MARIECPPKGKGSPAEYRTFLDQTFQRDSPYRLRLFRTWNQVRYYYLNVQWIEQDEDWDGDATHSPFWQPIASNPSSWTPMPVQNEFLAPIQNETARLVGTGSRPYVRPSDDSPRRSRAAKMSRDVLMDTQDRVSWTDQEHDGAHQMTLYGTWIHTAYWDIDYTKTVPLPVTDAVKCPQCDFRLASPKIPEGSPLAEQAVGEKADRFDVRRGVQPPNSFTPPSFKITAKLCPQCEPTMGPDQTLSGGLTIPGEPQPPPTLEPFIPDREEMKQPDALGRDMYSEEPIGDLTSRNVYPWNYFPGSGGLNMTARDCQEHGECSIETIEFIRAHFANGKLVKAEDVSELIRYHPVIGGTSSYLGGGSDPQLLTHHAELRRYYAEPKMDKDGKLDNGRALIMAGNVVLLDDDLLIPSRKNPGRYIKRAFYWSVPWELRDGELFGLGAGEVMVSEQDIINTTLGQVIDARHRFGSPKMLLEEGADLMYAGFEDTNYPSDVWYYRVGPSNLKPELFGNTQMGQGWQNEIDNALNAINRGVGTMDVETGQPPGKDITAASALMFMGEKAGERRKPRIARIKEFRRRLFSYWLEVISEYYRESRLLKVRGGNDRWTMKEFQGAELMEQTDVIVEDEPVYDVRLVRREAIKDALQAGTISADTASAKRKINQAWDVPVVNDEQNLQVELAEEEWLQFYEEGKQPVVKMRDDSHPIHYQQHQLDWNGQDCRTMRDFVDWNQIELALWGWSDDFDALQAAEQQLKLHPPPDVPPAKGGPAIDPATGQPKVDPLTGRPMQQSPQDYEASVQKWQRDREMADRFKAMPRALETRIFNAQVGILQTAGILSPPPPPEPQAPGAAPAPTPPPQGANEKEDAILALLKFNAHKETHYRLASGQASAVGAGASIPAPQGSPSTTAGMLPAGGGAQAGPGAGPSPSTASGDGIAA